MTETELNAAALDLIEKCQATPGGVIPVDVTIANVYMVAAEARATRNADHQLRLDVFACGRNWRVRDEQGRLFRGLTHLAAHDANPPLTPRTLAADEIAVKVPPEGSPDWLSR